MPRPEQFMEVYQITGCDRAVKTSKYLHSLAFTHKNNFITRQETFWSD
jgi:hypothetical protein